MDTFGVKVLALVTAVLCLAGYPLGGVPVVLGAVAAGITVLTWRVAVASRPPRPLGKRGGGSGAKGAPEAKRSAVLIRDQRDAHVVHDERREGEGVEHLVETEPAG